MIKINIIFNWYAVMERSLRGFYEPSKPPVSVTLKHILGNVMWTCWFIYLLYYNKLWLLSIPELMT